MADVDGVEDVDGIIRGLVGSSRVGVSSGVELSGKVASAVVDHDKKSKEKDKEPLRRKPELRPVPPLHSAVPESTPLGVLHSLGRAISLDGKGSARGIAEHWGCMKYALALSSKGGSGFMTLSAEGRTPERQHKKLQSEELAIGFGLVAVEKLLQERYPERRFSVVPAEAALRIGWPLTGIAYRPHFFVEAWHPDGPSTVFPVVCKGHHGRAASSHPQLASASAHVEAVHIGEWNQTPAYVLSTELSTKGPVVVHALQADGKGGVLPNAEDRMNMALKDQGLSPFIAKPADGKVLEEPLSGFHVPPQETAWFQKVLARTDAAGLAAFTGDNKVTADHLTRRQGKKGYEKGGHSAISSSREEEHTFLGRRFVGTDHVFRVRGVRVEVFSGVEADLFALLEKGDVNGYRRELDSVVSSQPQAGWVDSWNGAVSVRPDGSVLAIRRLQPDRQKEP